MLRGALAAAGDAARRRPARRGRVRSVRRVSGRGRARRAARARHDRRGLLYRPEERKRALELFLAAAGGRLQVAAHCGAQTTADTGARGPCRRGGRGRGRRDRAAVLPARRASAAGATSPPLPAACAPTPFYVYEFERASGYAVPLDVLHALRELAPNLAGLEVSDAPFDRFSPYLIEGLDVFVGPEALIHAGLGAGGRGRGPASPPRFRSGSRPSSRAVRGRLGRARRAARRGRALPAPRRAQFPARAARRPGTRGRAPSAAHS